MQTIQLGLRDVPDWNGGPGYDDLIAVIDQEQANGTRGLCPIRSESMSSRQFVDTISEPLVGA